MCCMLIVKINGELLVQLDEDMLTELKVTSKLHRLRLLNAIHPS